jgi:hypothetical protein
VLVRLLDIHVDESAGQLLLLPRRGRFACAQTHDDVLPPGRLTRVERDILDDAVALVEDSNHRDALRHWRDSAFAISGRGDLPTGRRSRVPLGALATRGKRERDQQRCGSPGHAYSGIQGS